MKKTIIIITILAGLLSCGQGLVPEVDYTFTPPHVYSSTITSSNYWVISNAHTVYYATNVSFVSNGAYVDVRYGATLFTNFFISPPFTSNFVN